jgi:hypothetical protein
MHTEGRPDFRSLLQEVVSGHSATAAGAASAGLCGVMVMACGPDAMVHSLRRVLAADPALDAATALYTEEFYF